MDPANDPKLSELLKEWRLPGAPLSLDAKVAGPRRKWWSFLLSGSVRLPMPIAVAIVAILMAMAVALVRRHPAPPQESAAVNLADFQPVKDMNIRIIRGHVDAK